MGLANNTQHVATGWPNIKFVYYITLKNINYNRGVGDGQKDCGAIRFLLTTTIYVYMTVHSIYMR